MRSLLFWIGRSQVKIKNVAYCAASKSYENEIWSLVLLLRLCVHGVSAISGWNDISYCRPDSCISHPDMVHYKW